MPAHAALMAHMDAAARQESERVKTKLQKIYSAYAGQVAIAEGSDESAKFVAVTYNEMTPEQQQMQLVAQVSGGGQIITPQRPPQVPVALWDKACQANPDPTRYVPTALIGAAALQGRLSWQQQEATQKAQKVQQMQSLLTFLRDRKNVARQVLIEKKRKHVQLRQRLLQVLQNVEIARAMGKPLQRDEFVAEQRLQELLNYEAQLRQEVEVLEDQALRQNRALENQYPTALVVSSESAAEKERIGTSLQKNADDINYMVDALKTDRRDVDLVHERVKSSNWRN